MSDRTEYFRAYYAARRETQNAFARAHPEYRRRYMERHGDEDRGRRRARHAANPQIERAKDKAWRDANPEKVRAGTLRAFYRLTPEAYEVMLAAQGGVCAICGRPERIIHRRTGQPLPLAVDHDHRCCPGDRSCGRCIRGLLCHACNAGGGRFGDDPALLRAAAVYFERPAAPQP